MIGKHGKSERFPILHESFFSIPFIEDIEGVVVTAYDSIMNTPRPATYSDVSIITNEEIGPLLGIAFYSNEGNSGAYFVSVVIAAFQDNTPEVFPAYKWLQGGDEILATSQTCKSLVMICFMDLFQSHTYILDFKLNNMRSTFHSLYN